MTSRRTTARGIALAAAVGLAAVLAGGAASSLVRVPRLIFPVVGQASYKNDFGEPRSEGWSHPGIDILAPRKAIAVAAETGTVKFWTSSATAGCMLYLYGESGTAYQYIHLNNDVGSRNDNKGKCVSGTAYAPRLKSGDRVEAGQAIGFVGDSGDANGIHPHLHFEVHPAGGDPVNPFKLLNRAPRLLFPADPATTVTLTVTGIVVLAAPDELKLRVSLLRVFPTGLGVAKLRRTVTLSLPATAQIDMGDGSLTEPGPAAASALAGKQVIVLTEPTLATLDAALGRPGSLAASRVALGPGLAGGP